MPAPLAYASPKQDALVEGERVLFTYERPPLSWRRDLIVAVSVGLVLVSCFIGATIYADDMGARLPLQIGSVIVAGIVGAVFAKRLASNKARPTVRLTTLRLVVTNTAADADVIQLPIDALGGITVKPARSQWSKTGRFGCAGEQTALVCRSSGVIAESTEFTLPSHAAQMACDQLFIGGLRSRSLERDRVRSLRRSWRPITLAEGERDAMTAHPIDPPLHLLPGEQVLWTGRPELRAAADFLRYARDAAKSAIWILLGLAIALAPWLTASSRDRSGVWIWSLFGVATVGWQAYNRVIAPLAHRSTLKRTQYALTNYRMIVRQSQGRRGHLEASALLDVEDGVAVVEPVDAGRSTVRTSTAAFEWITDAEVPYRLLIDALQGVRRIDAARVGPGPLAIPVATAEVAE